MKFCESASEMSRSTITLHVILFYCVLTWGYGYLYSYLSIPTLAIFNSLDQLTGRPYLVTRINYFIFSLMLYFLFALIWERENWRKALFIYNPFHGLVKGAIYSIVIAVIAFVLLVSTNTIKLDGLAGTSSHIFKLLFAWFVAQFFNAIREEVIYRGYLLRRLIENFNKHLCVVVVSVIFGIGHYSQYNLSGVFFATTFGLIVGYLYLYYKNIYVPIGMHAVWDICSHTILSGRIIAFEVMDGSYYSFVLITANLLFFVIFFIWKKLWRL